VNKRRSAERNKAWVEPLRDADVRRDVLRVLAGIEPSHTIAAAPALKSFDRPALVVWSRGDRVFPLSDGKRLAADLSEPLEVIDDTRTFIPLDQPDRLGALITAFVSDRVAVAPA
jgi:pimeloyl-ACP methyl ester carboxylesterase